MISSEGTSETNNHHLGRKENVVILEHKDFHQAEWQIICVCRAAHLQGVTVVLSLNTEICHPHHHLRHTQHRPRQPLHHHLLHREEHHLLPPLLRDPPHIHTGHRGEFWWIYLAIYTYCSGVTEWLLVGYQGGYWLRFLTRAVIELESQLLGAILTTKMLMQSYVLILNSHIEIPTWCCKHYPAVSPNHQIWNNFNFCFIWKNFKNHNKEGRIKGSSFAENCSGDTL